jgi:hypothetical protein
VYISVNNNNTNLNFLKILSNYTIWVRLCQKTISRYCPFKRLKQRKTLKRWKSLKVEEVKDEEDIKEVEEAIQVYRKR